MLYPQNGGRTVAIDSVPSFHPMFRVVCSQAYTVGVRIQLYDHENS